MSNLTLVTFCLFLLLSCRQKLEQKEEFFEGTDLTVGIYRLEGIGLEGGWVNDFRNFYIDNLPTLQKIKDQWVFEYTVPPSSCGYGYKLRLLRDKIIIKEAFVNIECEYISVNGNPWRYFPSNFLTDHRASFKRFTN